MSTPTMLLTLSESGSEIRPTHTQHECPSPQSTMASVQLPRFKHGGKRNMRESALTYPTGKVQHLRALGVEQLGPRFAELIDLLARERPPPGV